MVTQAKLIEPKREWTIEEFDQLPDPADDSYYELIDGEVILMPPPGGKHSNVTRILWEAIFLFNVQKNLGQVFPPARFQFPRFKAAPDLFFFRTERVPNLDQGAITIPADLAVEVWSRSDYGDKASMRIARKKVASYLKNGFRLVWVVRPDNKTVEIYHPGDDLPGQILKTGDKLDGEDVLPGFELEIDALFR